MTSGNRVAAAPHPQRAIIRNPAFDRVIIVLILLSSSCLAIDSPRIDDQSSLKDYLSYSEFIFTGALSVPRCRIAAEYPSLRYLSLRELDLLKL